MRVHLGNDHAGYHFVENLRLTLEKHGYEVVSHGPVTYDPNDDYPDFCFAAAGAVVRDIEQGLAALGVVVGGSGNGEQIAANKVRGVRAALAWNEDTARLARSHNDANVVAVGARMHTVPDACAIVLAFLAEPFSEDARHIRRIESIGAYEASQDFLDR